MSSLTSVKRSASISRKDEVKKPVRASAEADVELDVGKLHSLASEQQDQYLFNFVTTLERHITGLNDVSLRTQQGALKKELFQVIKLPTPAPSRVIRNTIGRCLTSIFVKGDRKLLFDTVTELGDLLAGSKVEKDLRNKHAAVHCLGEIYKAAGDGVINLSSVTCSALMKLCKNASNHVSIRAAVFRALGKISASIGGSLDENIARDIWKLARGAATNDRGALVQINSCWCLEQLINGTAFFNNTTDYDSLKTTVWKVGDSAETAVRHAAASCLSAMMIRAYSETGSVVPIPKTPRLRRPKKSTANQGLNGADEDDVDTMKLASPTWKKSALNLELSLQDMLRQLSAHYVRAPTSNKLRATIVSCYAKIFRTLETQIVETNFEFIAQHLLVDLLSNTVIAHHRYRLLLTRRFVQRLLGEVVGRQVLGESAQLASAKVLINSILRNYPQVLSERPEPSKNTLTGALNALASFIQALGPAFASLSDTCREALLQVLQHPSYTVQIHASYCLQLFTNVCPQQLLPCATLCMENLTKELGLLNSERTAARKSIGFANGLAAVLSISGQQPLYSSLEIVSKVLKQATNLLKSSANAELRVSGTQVQVAWVLIGGLMALGPNFVKVHLSQLLLLWRNALPRNLSKENIGQRGIAELSYLVHVRECALGSILSFLEYNSKLLTSDVSKRIAILLQNTISFLQDLPPTKEDMDLGPRIIPSLQLHDLVQMVRRRVLQCFTRLATKSPHTSKEILSQAGLLAFALVSFAEPEGYSKGSLGVTITNSANFDGIWNVADNLGFGISGLMRGLEIKQIPGEQDVGSGTHWHHQYESPGEVDSLLLSPICGAREHDSIYMYLADGQGVDELPDPPATEVVNSAIALFALALPLQSPKVQESSLEQLSLYLNAKTLSRDPGRKAAVAINIALALLGTLKVNAGETSASTGNLKTLAVEKCFDDLLRTLIIDPDKFVRNAAYEALGRLCNGAGTTLTATVVNSLVDTIVSNREPNARAGCAMALASINSRVGAMAAGFHLRKIHGILMSLCSDPHPTVHFWAIEALARVAESAGLTFSSYMGSTLGLLAQLWISDSHCEEADAIGTSNAELDLPTPAVIAHTIASLINVLGPDLQDMNKHRDLIITLVKQFDKDENLMVQVQALHCWQHIYLYAAGKVDFARYVRQLQRGLSSADLGVHHAAVDGLYRLMQRDAQKTMDAASDGLDNQIWTSLDKLEDQQGIRNIITAWLSQTCLEQPTQWIAKCQEILTRTITKATHGITIEVVAEDKGEQNTAPNMQDEEVAGFNVSDSKDDTGGGGVAGQELLRWQIRAFALECLSSVFAVCAKDLQANTESQAGALIQSRLADIIRMAFLASTSSVVELRIGGLRLVNQVLLVFGKTPDPDFAEALLLEQYQAQISSALTPAFGSDSTPELASAAVNVCATFISTGLVTDVDRMGRILKLLVAALSSFTVESPNPAIGELKGLSSNAQRMIKLSVLSAWAELQVASAEQDYLLDVLQPHVAKLTPLWLECLQDFARLRFEPDISSSMGASLEDPLDVVYAALNTQTLLSFYQDTWLTLLEAIASLVDQDSNFVFDALDGKNNSKVPNGASDEAQDINYRDEPVAFFFVLYGLAFEALVTRPNSNNSETQDQTLNILIALKKILRPSVAGNAIYQDIVFSETMDVFDRLAQTETLPVQSAIVEITRNLCLAHPSADEDAAEEQLSESIDQLFELTRIIVLVLSGVLPNLSEKPSPLRSQISDEAVNLIATSLAALVDAADVFPSIIRADLHACIIHIFTTILGTGACQNLVVPRVLPLLKRFIQNLAEDLEDGGKANNVLSDQLHACLARVRSILLNAQRRESDASLQCARNTLLAIVIVLSTGGSGISPKDTLLQEVLSDLLDCLADLGLGKVAANCCRSLLLSDQKLETSQAVASYLLPRMLHFVINPDQGDPDNAKPIALNALLSFLATLSPDGEQRTALVCMLLPALLGRAEVIGKDGYPDISARILAIAAGNQSTFRSVVGSLTAEQRNLMEDILRNAGIGKNENSSRTTGREEPTIALKMNFG